MSVKCPKCHHENPDTQSFCGDCGTRLGHPNDTPEVTRTFETPFPQFSPGTSLADRYEIIKDFGKGGMGEVYLAEDTNLKRKVAIKVLPKEFALDKERLARFEREARVLAALNHPNIATIHGLETSDGQLLLVMELVEGDTLAVRLKKGPMPVEEALEVCRQIAEGLESAHEKGIIHRDLKPGNIKITPVGKIKILDFGLAKAFQEEPEAIDLSKSPTLTDRMTQPGVILGTAAYMSPEQARSRPVDKRTDIWAFGCVLYECLTGKLAFQGETFSDTVAQILKGEPDWTKLPSNTPTTIKILLRRCLQKNPGNRLRDIGDVRLEMDEARDLPDQETTGKKRLSLNKIFIFTAAIILAGILIYSFVIRPTQSILPSVPIRSVIKVEPGHSLAGMRREQEFNWPSRTAMDISRDGSFIVYCAVNDDAGSDAKPQLFLRKLSQLNAEPIPGTEGGIAPFLSPDDRWLGFWSEEKLKKVSIEGGVPQDICKASGLFGASWGDDNNIIFSGNRNTGLFCVSSQGGKSEILTEPDYDGGELSHRLPSHLPKGKGVLFTIMNSLYDFEPSIAILEGETQKWRILLENAADARYIPSGHLVFLRQGTLSAIPFDLRKLDVYGQPVPIIPGVMQMLNSTNSFYNTASGQMSISDSGSLVYAPGGIIPDKNNLLVWVDQNGDEEPISSRRKHYFAPRLSLDGRKILYSTLGIKHQIWVYDIDRDISTPVISEGIGMYPNWTPDGKRIVFSWMSSSPPSNIHMISSDGSEAMERLITSHYDLWAGSFSPDGNLMAFLERQNNQDIFIYDFRDKSTTLFAATEHTERFPEFSPDGRWIAYCTDQEGHFEVYIRPSSGTGETIKASRGGGVSPLWARSGKYLFYRKGSQMWIVEVKTEPDISLTPPKLLFEKEGYGGGAPIRSYDISLDDQRFLMVKSDERGPRPVTEMILIQNWFEELKRLVPTRR